MKIKKFFSEMIENKKNINANEVIREIGNLQT